MESEKVPTIIVCLDTGNSSEFTLRYSCYKARKNGFALQILVVIEPSYKGLLFVSNVVGKQKRSEIEFNLKKIIDDAYQETGIIPSISIREGDIVTEIIKEIKATNNCVMLVLGKSHNSFSDNTVLPKIAKEIGNKIKIPLTVIPENLGDEYLRNLA